MDVICQICNGSGHSALVCPERWNKDFSPTSCESLNFSYGDQHDDVQESNWYVEDLCDQLSSLQKLPTQSIRSYISEGKSLVHALERAGKLISEQELVECLIDGLDASYDGVIKHYDLMKPQLSLSTLSTVIAHHDKSRHLSMEYNCSQLLTDSVATKSKSPTSHRNSHTYIVHKPKPNCESPPSYKQPPPAAKPSMFSSEPSPVPPKLSFIPDSPSSSSSSSSSCSSSSFGALPSSSKLPRVSNKPVLSRATFHPETQQTKPNYIWVENAAAPIYMIPEDIKDLIKKDIVPEVLKQPLSPSTYKDYFRSLLYAEDYYLEKWDGFEMEKVTLELHEAAIYNRKDKHSNLRKFDFEDNKVFVAFKMDSVPERRPFLLSRDFASLRPSGTNMEPFQGIIYRVVKSNLVLVEFGEEFHSQHHPGRKYDVKFSFNRVCLKRAHQAVESLSAPCFKNFLFPDSDRLAHIINSVSGEHLYFSNTLDIEEEYVVRGICGHQESVPLRVQGPLCVTKDKQPSRTAAVIREAVLQICSTEPHARILICAPTNATCDVIMKQLQKGIPESSMFRANAAFREIDGVPLEILPSCRYKEKEECFSVPLLEELRKYKIIVSTYMSCYRLHNEGLRGGDFGWIFMLDASLTIEPEVMVAVANLADEWTKMVVTGAPGNRPGWVRSKIARENGLRTSYFERLEVIFSRNLIQGLLQRGELDPRLLAIFQDWEGERT